MASIKRFLSHLLTTRLGARRTFPAATLNALQAEITAGEVRHRAQLRLIIEPALGWSQLCANTTSRGRAQILFSRYRVWDTEENCGVLIYINLADHKVEIIADRAVGRAVARTDWEAACRTMTKGFANGDFHDSALAGVAHVNDLLALHFPASVDGREDNELSDRPVLL